MKITTENAEETKKLAHETAESLKSGDVLALFGDLGSGKTTFVQGLADALGIPERTSSPTFLLVKMHELPEKVNGIEALFHLDLYRLDEPVDASSLGLSYFMGRSGTLTVIEWAEKMEDDLPKDVKRIRFMYLEDKKREITIENDTYSSSVA